MVVGLLIFNDMLYSMLTKIVVVFSFYRNLSHVFEPEFGGFFKKFWSFQNIIFSELL